ncbi:type II toxin-antitoxin system VapC family toxin [Acidiferrobacter sp.]|uniref:type II toxin-antitoxin system VapC family toxin n=1 Tax=Acidiferrobacter sp. TaxID=1872107 RepID=UPI0026394F8D|nr:type II toxin-antitoxin system VapC family toxin [Acidiferrobacter sp.]
MKDCVIDASIAIKWVIEEEGTREALAIRAHHRLLAPDLLAAECANILWKKVRRGELSADEAQFAARLLQAAHIEFLPAHSLLEAATRLAIEIGHPAYDCLYLALAREQDCPFITADEAFIRAVCQKHPSARGHRIMALIPARSG